MRPHHRSILRPPTTIALSLAIAACGTGRGSGNEHVARYTAVERARSDEAATLSWATDLTVDRKGQIYVADQSSVRVFAADGRLVHTLGRSGAGPGEFSAVVGVGLTRDDTVYAFDSGRSRLTFFEPKTDRAAQVVQVGRNQVFPPIRILRSARNGSLLGIFEAAYGDFGGREKGRRKAVVRLLAADGSLVRDSVLAVPETEHLMLHNPEGVAPSPFGRSMFFALTSRDHVVTLWSDSLTFDLYSLAGRHLKTIRASYVPPRRRITDQERDSVVASMANEIVPAASVRRAVNELGATTWPLAQEMFVDDDDRIWVGITGARGEPTHWTAFDEDGARVAQVDLPTNVTLQLLRGTTAYGVMKDENDVPRVVVYDLKPTSTPAPERP